MIGGGDMLLEMMVRNKRRQLREQRLATPYHSVADAAAEYGEAHPAKDFAQAVRLADFCILPELKRGAPGTSYPSQKMDIVKMSAELEAAGVPALLVVTEETFFKARKQDLALVRGATGLPVVRSDLILSEWQVCESRAQGADAVLLIAALHDLFTLRSCISVARLLHMQCLVEVSGREELARALEAGAQIVVVQGRSRGTFELDLRLTARLRTLIPPGVLCIAAGGSHRRTICGGSGRAAQTRRSSERP